MRWTMQTWRRNRHCRVRWNVRSLEDRIGRVVSRACQEEVGERRFQHSPIGGSSQGSSHATSPSPRGIGGWAGKFGDIAHREHVQFRVAFTHHVWRRVRSGRSNHQPAADVNQLQAERDAFAERLQEQEGGAEPLGRKPRMVKILWSTQWKSWCSGCTPGSRK